MKVLVINGGSSSFKYQLIEMDTETVLAKGLAERIGLEQGKISHEYWENGQKNKVSMFLLQFPTLNVQPKKNLLHFLLKQYL